VIPQLFVEYSLSELPRIDAVGTAAGNQFTIQFTARAGHAYVVECRDALSLSGTTCTNLPVQGATGPVSVSLPLTGAQRFFRVGEQ
jgi:hypothetical protein